MNAAGTMARVYHALKASVMAGHFAPGERIDPSRLSMELSASATPIREALHRLAGERLVESWSQEGFRQPIYTEGALRDLYQWSEDLTRLLVRSVERRRASDRTAPFETVAHPAGQTAEIFNWLAGLTLNTEYQFATASLNDRAHTIRVVEDRLLADSGADLASLMHAIAEGRWGDARRAALLYHGARMRIVSDIVAHLRRREP